MRDLLVSAADLLLGAHCAGCGRPALTLCRACGDSIRASPTITWPDPCPAALRWPRPVAPIASGAHADVLRRVLVAWKEEGATRLTPIVAHLLAASVAELARPGRPLALVPVPASRRSRHARGCDLIDELARSASRFLGRTDLDVSVVQAAAPARATADQSALGAVDRARNLNGAFRLRSDRQLVGRDVVVVDDILTTGATVSEVVRVLTAADHRPIGIAVVAATARTR